MTFHRSRRYDNTAAAVLSPNCPTCSTRMTSALNGGIWVCPACSHWESATQERCPDVPDTHENGDGVLRNRLRGATNQATGKHGEGLARDALTRLGLRRIERIEVGHRVIRDDQGTVIRVIPIEKVSGDFKAMMPGGVYVHIEVKHREERLRFGDLKPHQVDALNEHTQLGGIGLVCWVSGDDEVFILQWPIPDFVPRKSLSLPRARQLKISSLQELVADLGQ